MWIVFNEARTEGFVTNDEQLAYEVRKSSGTNCYDMAGEHSPVGAAFCERWAQDNCETVAYDSAQLALLRAQLATRDAALDAVLEWAMESDGADYLLTLLARHGIHPK